VGSPNALYSNGDYHGALLACAASSVRNEIARSCLLAACRERASAQQARWLDAIGQAKHNELLDECVEIWGNTAP
jgi:hypothetical protein